MWIEYYWMKWRSTTVQDVPMTYSGYKHVSASNKKRWLHAPQWSTTLTQVHSTTTVTTPVQIILDPASIYSKVKHSEHQTVPPANICPKYRVEGASSIPRVKANRISFIIKVSRCISLMTWKSKFVMVLHDTGTEKQNRKSQGGVMPRRIIL